MAGSRAGTGKPHFLKCSRCKLQRTESGSARTGTLRRTGRTRAHKARGKGGPGRTPSIAYECKCLDCKHVGWYAHSHAPRLPLLTEA